MKCALCDNETKGSRRLCEKHWIRVRRYRIKLAALHLLGDKCKKCGYNENIRALEFHHLGDKEFQIGRIMNKSWDFIKKELEKCIILCSNCHRMEHSHKVNEQFLSFVFDYKANNKIQEIADLLGEVAQLGRAQE